MYVCIRKASSSLAAAADVCVYVCMDGSMDGCYRYVYKYIMYK